MRIFINLHPEDKEKRQCTAKDVIDLALTNPNRAPNSWRAAHSFLGDCHTVINGLLNLLDQIGKMDGWMVAQADIPGGQGWHSWLEFDGWVVDFASGTYAISDIRRYYEMKKPSAVRYLTPHEFQLKWKTETGKWWLSNPPK